MKTASEHQKAKNLSALVILLVGLFVGSLFVDFVQLATGQGFSGKAVKEHNLLETAGKTWVAYDDPKVTLQVVNDSDCEQCDPNEALVWLRRIVPTIEAVSVESDSDLGQALINRFQIVTVPAFVFSKSITETDFYAQAQSLFREESGRYFLDMTKIGLTAGKYLQLPKVESDSITIGPKDAAVTLTVFSDFQCAHCKTYQQTLTKVLKEYEGKVLFVFKQFPLASNKQAENAALASECANEQGKFETYAAALFGRQNDWGNSVGTQKFKNYAWMLRLDGRKFSQCLDEKKYQEKVNADKNEAASFMLSGTPVTFVNDTLLSGAVSQDELKAAIDKELAE